MEINFERKERELMSALFHVVGKMKATARKTAASGECAFGGKY